MLRKGFFGGVAAGIMIGLGGAVYLACDNKYVGAVMFSVALLSICMMSLFLFTGKVGFLVNDHKKDDFVGVLSCLFGNFVGTGLSALMVRISTPAAKDTAYAMCNAKLDKTLPAVFCSAILCGILMYTAVKIFKDKNSVWGIFFCVPVFILSGFEHSIADMFYFWVSGIYAVKTLVFIAVVVLGNSIGGCLLPLISKCTEGKKNEG